MDTLERIKRIVVQLHEAGKPDAKLAARYVELYAELEPVELCYLDHFQECILEGCSERLAEMYAGRCPPQVMTDAVFMEGTSGQFGNDPATGQALKQIAQKAGGRNITDGYRYMGGLARYPGDPEAWVTGRGDVERVLRSRGWGAFGAVNVEPREPVPKRQKPKIKPFLERLREKLGGLPSGVVEPRPKARA